MNTGKILVGIAALFLALVAARFAMPGRFGFDAYAQPSMMHGGVMGHKPWMNDSDWNSRSTRDHRETMGGMSSINSKLPLIDVAALPAPGSTGAKLMASYCTQCHNLPSPAMHSRDDWPTIIERMYRRIDMMERSSSRWKSIKAPNGEEKQRLSIYIVSHAMRPFDPITSSQPDSPESIVFRNTCGRCHGLPDPGQHTAGEWPSVVARMKTNAKNMNKPMPDAGGIGQIIRFLQTHARKG